jgi:catechol 2,3-dioxygenase-like lactoylglutathione lyase family enzyme
MEDALTRVFNNFDRGRISRRQLMQALGLAAVTAPVAGFGQGRCFGTRAGTPECDTKPFPAPFEPTGWKTVLLDHFSVQVADLQKEAAFFNALMGWKVRSNDGKTIVMDMGTLGGVVMRGGYQPPPPTSQPAASPAAEEGAGRGGRGGGGGRGPQVPRRAIWDNFCWGIEPWDTKKVEAELKKRGLNPVADHDGKDFFSFHVKDPDGFDLQVSNGNKKNRRTTAAKGEVNASPPFEATGWQTIYLNHISFEVTSYKETVAFYQALLGWKSLGDEGSQSETEISPDIGYLLIRGGNANAPGGLTGGRGGQPVRRAQMGHICFDIADFDPDKVKAELLKRGLNAREDTGATTDSPPAEHDIHTSTHKSYHTTTPNGYDLQISLKVKRG